MKDSATNRPEFAVTLGLLPPYAMEDVKRAYLAKVKDAHPDRGGDRAQFDKIQHAFEQAREYLGFRSDRRQWIAARMEQYVAVAELVERLRQMGAEVETSILDWVKLSFGDFASLTEAVVGIRRREVQDVSQLVDMLVRERDLLVGLKRLDLAGSAVNDALALQLRVFTGLTHLDLSRTAITDRSLELVDWLPKLEDFGAEGVPLGWWARRKLRKTLASRQGVSAAAILHAVNTR